MCKYRALIQYVGTRYSGWQVQKDRITIQGILQKTLAQVTRTTSSVIGASRTDTGVHALGQVAHFDLDQRVGVIALRKSLNGVLPWDIRVLRLSLAPSDFHARKWALKKRYRYRIYNGQVLSPFLAGYVHHVTRRLDFERMQRAAPLLIGSHNFRSFAASSTQVRDHTRTVFLSQFRRKGCDIVYQVEANGFLHHMVRNLAGTFLQVGNGQLSVQDMVNILNSRDRRKAGPTAPAHGLYLTKIWYP